MKITIITLIPDYFESFKRSFTITQAIEHGRLQLDIVDLKEYAEGRFRKIDESPYGGGPGLILRMEPMVNALRSCHESAHKIIFTPSGRTYNQTKAHDLAQKEELVLLCGHYEGFDERILNYVDEEISLGDFVLTGGEIPAMAIVDSLCRLSDGVLKPGAVHDESFEHNLLEYPQYTRPQTFEGHEVPSVLLSGDHRRIQEWRLMQSIKKTEERRPDLMLKKNNDSFD